MSRSLRSLVAAPFPLVGLAACGSSVLTADTVASSAEDALEKQIGVRPAISCADDVDKKVGAQTGCSLTAGDDPTTYGVTVTVASVDGDNATFDVRVDDEPLD